MESLRGIFPRTDPRPPKRDFLKENVMRVKSMGRFRKPTNEPDYSNINNKYKQLNTRKINLNENNTPMRRSTHSLQSKASSNNLRKTMSTMSIQSSTKDFGVQTCDPENDEFFLKDTIIRYPSASTVRSIANSQTYVQTQPSKSCTRGHPLNDEELLRTPRRRNDRRDEHSERIEHHLSNLSEYLDKGSVGSRSKQQQPASILKSSSSLQKLNKNSFNESQQKEDRTRIGSAHHHRAKIESIDISSDDDTNEDDVEEKKIENRKESTRSRNKEKSTGGGADLSDAKKKQLQAAENDPNCPEGHVPLTEDERLESLKLAKKRKASPFIAFIAMSVGFQI
jgi:hypothetical protein